MKAVVLDKKQEHKLRFADLEIPTPEDNEVLVKTAAVSVNAADYRSIKLGIKPKRGAYGGAITGVIEKMGPGVTEFEIGDRILADLADSGFGSFAEYAAVPGDLLVKMPAALSFNEASCLPIAATTALKGLRDKGELQKGQNILIVGAAGSVGPFAVQIAKLMGGVVTAVCGPNNMAQTQQLGADKVIDYSQEDFMQASDRYDVILAINGNYTLRAYKRLLKPGGIYVMIGGAFSQILRSIFFGKLMSVGGKRFKVLSAKADAKSLEIVAHWMAEGKIRAVIEKVCDFDETIEAIAYLVKGHARGKVVVVVNSTED